MGLHFVRCKTVTVSLNQIVIIIMGQDENKMSEMISDKCCMKNDDDKEIDI